MRTKTSRKKYVESWNHHVNVLSSLGWNLSEKEDREEIENIQKRLTELVEKASLKQPEV